MGGASFTPTGIPWYDEMLQNKEIERRQKGAMEYLKSCTPDPKLTDEQAATNLRNAYDNLMFAIQEINNRGIHITTERKSGYHNRGTPNLNLYDLYIYNIILQRTTIL